MKKILLLVLLFTSQLFSQTIPCEFSWADAPTTNGNYNFLTSAKTQPYQGPCLTFAFNAAIETKYAIENSINNPSLKLSEAFLDYKIWGINNFETTLEGGFKIPTTNGVAYDLNTFPPGCSVESTCHYVSQTRNCVNNSQGPKSYKFNLIEVNGALVIDPQNPVTCMGSIGSYMTVNNVTELTNITTINQLKTKILSDGPIVLRVNGLINAKKFRNYNTPTTPFSYHAFTIVGWTNNSKWIIKDSWNGMQGTVSTKPNPGIISLINSSMVKLYQVSGISYNGNAHSQNPANLSVSTCTPALQLSNILVDLHYVTVGGYLYSKFWVTSNLSVDTWVWGIDYPNGALKRSQVNSSNFSSILMSPTTSGTVTIFVNGYKNGVKVTKERILHLSNGQTGGGGMN